MPRKLKVFEAQFGFYDTVVSAPSQAAALRAWGAHQDLFGDGAARLATDQQAIAAALAQPGIPLRRAVGSKDPFALDPRPPAVPTETSRIPHHRKAEARAVKASPKPTPPPPDRTRLAAAEAAVATLERERRSEEQDFAARRAAFEKDVRLAQRAFDAAHAKARKTVVMEERAFIRATKAAR